MSRTIVGDQFAGQKLLSKTPAIAAVGPLSLKVAAKPSASTTLAIQERSGNST